MAEDILNNPNNNPDGTNGGAEGNNGNQAGNNQSIDYAKIQQMLDGTLKAKEETALKAYFKQHGISQEEMDNYIADFKAKQKEKAPDVDSLNTQLQEKDAKIKSLEDEIAQRDLTDAVKELANELNFDVEYAALILKNANAMESLKEDGTIDAAKLKEKIKTFLEKVPVFKKSTTINNRQFKTEDVGRPKPEDKGKEKPKTARGKIDAIFN